MAITITIGIQKGGVSKTTTTGIVAHLMTQEQKRVLVVDMDSQGNVTDLLTQLDPEKFEGRTILEAFEEMDADQYIIKVNDYLDVLPADDFLSTLPRWLYMDYMKTRKPVSLALYELLRPLQDRYDYILIDTPPSLSEHTINAVCASDYVVVLAESSKWAFTAIPRFIATAEHAAKKLELNLKVTGILRTMNDSRRADSKAFVQLIGDEYPELVFDTVIKRKAATGRLSFEGFEDNKELESALEMYKGFYEELKTRIGVKANV